MRIAVIGAGIVGVSTAYELAEGGHSVQVFERNAAIAEEASFAPAGTLSPALAHPLAHPSWPEPSWLGLLRGNSGITLHRQLSLEQLRWYYQWKSRYTPDTLRPLMQCAHALISYSQERMQALLAHSLLEMERSQGLLQLFDSAQAQAIAEPRLAMLKELGIVFHLLDAQSARRLEPGLATEFALHSAVHFPQDESANCRQFAHFLKDQAQQLGVRFHFSSAVQALSARAPWDVHCGADRVHAGFDAVVLCCPDSAPLLPGGRGKLPLTRLSGYSISLPLREALNAPRGTVLEPRSGVSLARLGSRLRVSGGAELGSRADGKSNKTIQRLYHTLQTHFPGAAAFKNAGQAWKGSCAFTPDALPLVGASAEPGVWLNLGHGYGGWAMACACARILADQIAQRPTAVDTTRLAPTRFRS